MELNKMRQAIDRIDTEIIQLLTRRMEHAVRTKRFKTDVVDGSRESKVLESARTHAHGLIEAPFSEELFKRIMSESRRLQELNLPLATFHGEHGSYSEVALLHYNDKFVGIPCIEFSQLFEAVENGAVDYGIVPIENSLEGAESEIEDLLIESTLHIVGEVVQRAHHSLLTLKKTDYREIKDVYSTPRALSQCKGFIERNKLTAHSFDDNASAALMLLKEQLPGAAVIASSMCARLYDLEVVKENIEDNASISSRYLILSKKSEPEGGNKCSIVFVTQHKVGALYEALGAFYKAGVNLTRIESRPLRREPGQVAFLLDFAGSESDPKVLAALEELRKHTTSVRMLGCYKMQEAS